MKKNKSMKMLCYLVPFLAFTPLLANAQAVSAPAGQTSPANAPAAQTPSAQAPAKPALLFYPPLTNNCANLLAEKNPQSIAKYNSAILGELSGLETGCRLSGTDAPTACVGNKIKDPTKFVANVQTNCKLHSQHSIAEITFSVWKWLAVHDLKL